MNEQERQTLTIEEAAEMIGISVRNAYRQAAAGTLPGARRIGGRVLVSRPALLRWLETGEANNAAP